MNLAPGEDVERKQDTINLPVLTGLRAVAALSVLVGHAVQMAFPERVYGTGLHASSERLDYYGMSIFFVLSGCVLMLNYGDGLATPGQRTRYFLRFWGARLARLLPLYYFVLLMYVAMTPWDNNPLMWRAFPRYLILMQTWYDLWQAGGLSIMRFYPHSWSVSTEMFFYVCFPVIVWMLGHMRGGLLRLVVAAYCVLMVLLWLDVMIGGALMKYLITTAGADTVVKKSEEAYHSPYVRIVAFFMGCIVGKLVMLNRRADAPSHTRRNRILSVLCVAVMTASLYPTLNLEIREAGYPTAPMMFSGLVVLLVYGVCVSDSAVSRLLSSRATLFIGEISYSMYLLHFIVLFHFKSALTNVEALEPLDSLLRLVCMLSLTVVLAYGSYRIVEVPSRRFLRRLFGVVPKPVSSAVPEGLLAATGAVS